LVDFDQIEWRHIPLDSNRQSVPWLPHISQIKSVLNVKQVKFTLEQAMKAQRGRIGIALLFV